MAKACSPHTPPFVSELGEDGYTVINDAFKTEGVAERFWAGRLPDAVAIGRLKNYLSNALPLSFDELDQFFIEQGWLKKSGDIKINSIDNLQELGFAAAVTKTYLESRAAGMQLLADNFLKKISEGQLAMTEALQFAGQMQGLSKFINVAAKIDQKTGQALRIQGLRKRDAAMVERMGLKDIAVADETVAEAEKYMTMLDLVREKLNTGRTTEAYDDLITFAKRVQFVDNPMDIARTFRDVHLPAKMFDEMWINGVLSGPQTLITNATSFAWAVARPMFQLGAATIMEPLFPKTAQLAAAEASATLNAMYSSLNDAWQIGWKAGKMEREAYARYAGGSTLEYKSQAITYDNLNQQLGGRLDPGLEDIVNTIGGYVRLPSRILMGTDQFTKHLAIRGEIAAQGIQRAVRDGVELSDKAAVAKYLDNELNRALLNRGTEDEKLSAAYDYYEKLLLESDTSTFQEENKLARSISDVMNKAPYLKPFMPFVRTPLNILKQGFVESTGLDAVMTTVGIIKDDPLHSIMKIQQELMRDPGESFRLAGQIGFTTAMFGSFYMMAQSGLITGGGPGRWAKDGPNGAAQTAWERAMNAEGRVPYSIRIGDTSVPFDRVGEPLAIVLRMAADLGMFADYTSVAEQDNAMFGAVAIISSGLFNASFLKNINDITMLLRDTSADALNKSLGVQAQNYFASFTPFGGFLNYVDKIGDPYRHAYRGATFTDMVTHLENTFSTGLFAKAADRFPGVSATPLLIDQITGQPVPSYTGGGPQGLNPLQMAVPFFPRGVESADKTWRQIYEIAGSYREKRPQSNQVQLTIGEQQKLNKRMAEIRLDGMTVSEAINRFYQTPQVQDYVKRSGGLVPSLKADVERELDSITRAYMEAALDDISASDLSLIQRRALAVDTYQKERAGDIEGVRTNRRQITELLQLAGTGNAGTLQ